MTQTDFPPPAPETRATGYQRFRSEVMAGGAVGEQPQGAGGEPIGGGLSGAIGGLAIVGLLGWLAVANLWMFVFVVGVLVSVFLHELGHFATARLTGMKATQFFIGFGPRLWSFQRGETEYGVRLLPLGTFVRIVGMNNLDAVAPEDEARTYRQQTFPRRLLVISAGSLMHLLFAVVLFFSVFATRGEIVALPGAEVRAVATESAAAAAGIEPGDTIVSVGGVELDDNADLGDAVRQFAPGDTVDVSVRRDGATVDLTATLGMHPDLTGELAGAAFLGVGSVTPTAWSDVPLGEAARRSVTDLFPYTWESTKGIVKVLNPVNVWQHLTGVSDELETRPTTMLGVTQVSGEVGESQGLAGVVLILAALNVFIAVFNMFPLLPLDGGHAAIAVYERIREIGKGGGRYFTDVSRLIPFTMGVIAILLFLFMTGLYLDISQPL